MKKLIWFLRRRRLIFTVFLLAVAGAAGFLAQRHHWHWDVTQNGRHTLSQASRNVLDQIPGAIVVTAYAALQDPQHGDLRQPIREFVARYQRLKPDLELKFIDPLREPELARAAEVQLNGELVLAYHGRSEHLVTLNEQDFSNALVRLARGRERVVMFLAGHGERKLDGDAPHDVGEFGRQLTHKGFRVAPLNLAVADEVPADVNVLVLTQPRTEILAGEADRIRRYLARGGNLLWLLEPGPLQGLRPVAEVLGLNLTPGTIVDPAAREAGFPLTTAVAAQYGMHPVTAGFDLITVFPHARAVGANDDPAWRVTPLVEVAERGWVENGTADENARLDAGRDVPGPVVTALALERESEEGGQRVAVIGSGGFLANAYLGNGGNLDLGIGLVNWLAGDARLIAIRPKNTLDASLSLGRSGAMALALGFLIAVPLVFFLAAFFVWRRRHA